MINYELDSIIKVDGEDYRIIGVSDVIDGERSLHLASTTRGNQQRNGWVPCTIIHWVPAE
jgi:hypothetical protein